MSQGLIASNIAFLRQALDLLERISPELYTQSSGDLSPVGAHLRHVIDHYQSLIHGVRAERVDYEDRERDSAVEQDRGTAAVVVGRVIEEMSTLRASGAVQVRMNHGGGEEPTWSQSSVERELQFLVSHTVHHFALIKAVLQQTNLPLGADFGVAPSTLAHRSDPSCAH